MSEFSPTEPAREHPKPTVCVCRLKVTERPEGTVWDSCSATTSGPDEPVCHDCVDSGHPDSEHFHPIIKRSNQ